MEKLFVPYELALKLKELGFNEVCLANYNNLTNETRLLLGKTDEGCITWNKTPDQYNAIINSNERILAPLWQQAFSWFRNEYKFKIGIGINDKGLYYDYKIVLFNTTDTYYKDYYNTYTEAQLACLEKLIGLCGTL